MAYGRAGSESGGVIDAVDVRGGGSMEWAQMVGVKTDHPLVSGGPYPSIEARWNRVITTSAGQAGPATETMATPEGAPSAAHRAHTWRETFNFHGSPIPWLLIAVLAIVLMVHFSINAEGGAFGRHLRAGASVS